MSDTDSFIEEVTEEVRRDRLYKFLRKYAWVGILAVVTIVGGTAYLEFQKAQARTEAAEELRKVEVSNLEARAIVAMLLAAEEISLENYEAASASLNAIFEDSSILRVYRDMAKFKFLLISLGNIEDNLILAGFKEMAVPGNPFRLLAEEQIALLTLKTQDIDTAVDKLKSILEDAELTDTMRQRVSQLLMSLGVDPSSL